MKKKRRLIADGRYEVDADETVWPALVAADDLEWELRYADAGTSFEKDRLYLASIVSAYSQLRHRERSGQ